MYLQRKKYMLYYTKLMKSIQYFSGDDYREEIPVPIPNTEVKLSCAEDICELPCWENRLSPDFLCLKIVCKAKKRIRLIKIYIKDIKIIN